MYYHILKGDTIIVESTIAPRTMDDHVKPLIEEKGFTIGEDVYLVHCPRTGITWENIRRISL